MPGTPQTSDPFDDSRWWDTLSDHERCLAVARALEFSGATAAEIVYAVEKPWKYVQEAYEYKEEVERANNLEEEPKSTG